MVFATPKHPMPTTAQVRELHSYLGAHHDVFVAEGRPEKAAQMSAMIQTLVALNERAEDLSLVERVVVLAPVSVEAGARMNGGRIFDEKDLYAGGAVIDVQDGGRTLKVFPTPTGDAAMDLLTL